MPWTLKSSQNKIVQEALPKKQVRHSLAAMFLAFDGTINRLRSIGSWEAVSYLLLLFVAMPLKYLWHWEAAVQVVGMAHGLLWMAYIGLAWLGQIEGHWTLRTTLLLFIASLLPFGPFVADAKLLRKL